jgi:hypothetical protein
LYTEAGFDAKVALSGDHVQEFTKWLQVLDAGINERYDITREKYIMFTADRIGASLDCWKT